MWYSKKSVKRIILSTIYIYFWQYVLVNHPPDRLLITWLKYHSGSFLLSNMPTLYGILTCPYQGWTKVENPIMCRYLVSVLGITNISPLFRVHNSLTSSVLGDGHHCRFHACLASCSYSFSSGQLLPSVLDLLLSLLWLPWQCFSGYCVDIDLY